MHYEGVGGPLLNTLPIPKLEYADVAITNKTIEEAPMRLSALSAGAPDAFLDMSMKKAKYRPTIKYYVTEITEAEVIALNLKFKCQACGRSFPTEKGLKIMTAQYARGGAVLSIMQSNMLSGKAKKLNSHPCALMAIKLITSFTLSISVVGCVVMSMSLQMSDTEW